MGRLPPGPRSIRLRAYTVLLPVWRSNPCPYRCRLGANIGNLLLSEVLISVSLPVCHAMPHHAVPFHA